MTLWHLCQSGFSTLIISIETHEIIISNWNATDYYKLLATPLSFVFVWCYHTILIALSFMWTVWPKWKYPFALFYSTATTTRKKKEERNKGSKYSDYLWLLLLFPLKMNGKNSLVPFFTINVLGKRKKKGDRLCNPSESHIIIHVIRKPGYQFLILFWVFFFHFCLSVFVHFHRTCTLMKTKTENAHTNNAIS